LSSFFFKPVNGYFDPNPYVLVGRVVFESLGGDVPFYELTEVGGSIRGVEVGGGSFMRGYKSRRFADTQKMLYSAELRRIFTDVQWRGQYAEMLGMLFVDAGRVAPRVESVLSPADLHWSGGLGCRITWNSQLSLRSDIAFSPEGHVLLLSFGNLF